MPRFHLPRLSLRPALAAGLLSLLVLPVRLAAESSPSGFLLPAGTPDHRALVPPPPAPDSVAEATDRELAVLFATLRTPEQTALARNYVHYDVFALLRPVLGPEATPENLPRLAAFFRQATRSARPFTDAAKDTWKRPRPFVTNPALQPAVEPPDGWSYPSGHATGAALHATLLAALLPEYAGAWEHQAALVRWSRLVGGVHYPSDVVAGQRLGEALGLALLQSPEVQQALAEVRAELAAWRQRQAA